MKNFNQFILTLLAAGLFASCSLTEEPTSFVNRKSFYKNESQCIAALNSCYMPANAIYTANFMLVTEACTDIWYSSSTTVAACTLGKIGAGIFVHGDLRPVPVRKLL